MLLLGGLSMAFFRLITIFVVMAIVSALGQSPQKRRLPSSDRGVLASNDEVEEEEHNRIALQRDFERGRSDANGHIRPDLRAKAIAHIGRMTVVSEIGPAKRPRAQNK